VAFPNSLAYNQGNEERGTMMSELGEKRNSVVRELREE